MERVFCIICKSERLLKYQPSVGQKVVSDVGSNFREDTGHDFFDRPSDDAGLQRWLLR
jgi:hypothetical protein